MEINEIYEIKDMYDVKLLLSKYIDVLKFIQCSLDSSNFDKEQLKTVLGLLEEHTILNMKSIK